MTLNEARAVRGLPPFEFKEANMSMLQTQRGMAYIAGSSDLVPAGVLIEPASEHPDVQGDDVTIGNTPAPKPAPAKQDAQKAVAELVTFRKWAKRQKADDGAFHREFKCDHLTEELAKQLAPDLVGFKASDSGPKVPYLDKDQVNYRAGTSTANCGNCTMFSNGLCNLVKGEIDPGAVCDQWSPKPSSVRPDWSPYSAQSS